MLKPGWVDVTILIIISAIFLFICLTNLGFPGRYNLDEAYYVPGARSYSTDHLDPNPRHPPLAKILIGISMKIFGDNPSGWRYGSVTAGLLIVILTYFFGLYLFKSRVGATAASFLLSIDFLHIVQSRIATLDIYTSFFILLAFFMAFLYIKKYFREEQDPPLLNWYSILCALCIGLALSSKLSALFGFIGIIATYFLILWIKQKRIPILFSLKVVSIYLPIIIIVYLIAHIPLFVKGISPSYLLYRDTFTLHYGIKQDHPQLAKMWQWILLQKPMWYYWQNDVRAKTITGISAMGNFIFWWSFLGIFIQLMVLTILKKRPYQIIIVMGYLSLYLGWLSSFQVIDGHLSFKGGYFYYMLPCVPFMSLTIAETINRVWKYKLGKINVLIYLAAILFFLVRFYPLLKGIPMKYEYFDKIFSINIYLLLAVCAILTLQLYSVYLTGISKYLKKNHDKCL